MNGSLTIPTDSVLEGALRKRARERGLPVADLVREILRQALGASESPTAGPGQRSGAGRPGDRQREQEWRRSHREQLRELSEEWVVLEGEDIIAHGKDPARLVEQAREKGVERPYIFYVEPPRAPGVVKIGL